MSNNRIAKIFYKNKLFKKNKKERKEEIFRFQKWKRLRWFPTSGKIFPNSPKRSSLPEPEFEKNYDLFRGGEKGGEVLVLPLLCDASHKEVQLPF